MNIELLRAKMTEYFRTVTPEEIIADYESMGVVFEDIPDESVLARYQYVAGQPSLFDQEHSEWHSALLLEPTIGFSNLVEILPHDQNENSFYAEAA